MPSTAPSKADITAYDSVVRNLEYSMNAPEPIQDLIEKEFIKITREKTLLRAVCQQYYEKGKKIAFEEMKNQVRTFITDYLGLLNSVAKKINEDLSGKIGDLAILSYYAKFTPSSQELSFFLIIECNDFEKNIEFSFKLSELEKSLLLKDNKFCEILFAAKDDNLDIAAIKRDYPICFNL